MRPFFLIFPVSSMIFRSSRSTAYLFTVLSDRIFGTFNRSGSTGDVVLNISKVFVRIWNFRSDI